MCALKKSLYFGEMDFKDTGALATRDEECAGGTDTVFALSRVDEIRVCLLGLWSLGPNSNQREKIGDTRLALRSSGIWWNRSFSA